MSIIKSPHCFYRLLTPDMLKTYRAAAVDTMTASRTGMRFPDDALPHDSLLFRVPLIKEGDIKSSLTPDSDDPEDFEAPPPLDLIDLTIDVNVGLRWRQSDQAEAYDAGKAPRLTFLVAEMKCEDEDGIPHGMGFQIRDPREFHGWGPYRGVEARVVATEPRPGEANVTGTLDANSRPAYLPDDRGDLGAIEFLGPDGDAGKPRPVDRGPAEIPERIEMTLKPNAWWGRCASSVQGGHSVSVAPFFSSLDVSAGLYLDVYGRKPGKSFYEIRYVEVAIHC